MTQDECIYEFEKIKLLLKMWDDPLWVTMEAGEGMGGEPENHYFAEWLTGETWEANEFISGPCSQREGFYSVKDLEAFVKNFLTTQVMIS